MITAEEIVALDQEHKRLEAENEALRKSVEELRTLVKRSFVDGYAKAEDGQSRGDSAWEYSQTKEELEAITKDEYEDINW